MKQDTLEGKAKTKNGVKRLCFSIVCILLEVVFIITIVTRLNEYAEIINLFTRILSGILVLGLYASDKTSSCWMYKVNDWFPNYGCSRYQVQPGDVICWVYTCDLGYDVGGGFMGG